MFRRERNIVKILQLQTYQLFSLSFGQNVIMFLQSALYMNLYKSVQPTHKDRVLTSLVGYIERLLIFME